jgi:hypothetical protein
MSFLPQPDHSSDLVWTASEETDEPSQVCSLLNATCLNFSHSQNETLEYLPPTYNTTFFRTQSSQSFHSLYSNPTASPSYLTNSPLPSFHVFSHPLLLPFQPAFFIKLINASSFVQPCSSATLGRYVAP